MLKDEELELDDLEDAELELVLAFIEVELLAGLVNVAEDIEVEVELFEVLCQAHDGDHISHSCSLGMSNAGCGTRIGVIWPRPACQAKT